MKAKSTLIFASLALALLMTVAPARAEAQCCSNCCFGEVLAAPFVAVGAVVVGAVAVTAAVVSAPFTALSCGNCGISLCNPCNVSLCNPCGSPSAARVTGNYGRF